MIDRSPRSTTPRIHWLALRAGAVAGAATLAATSLAVAGVGPAAAASPLLKSAGIPNYARVLENGASRSLYVLSTERGAKVHCTAACASTWHPLVVRSTVKSVSVGAMVKGKVGFVKRTATTKQVTFNSYPLYTYTGDAGPSRSSGEAVAADGGVWHLVHASAATAGGTPYAPILNSANVPATTYKGVLANSSSRSLYVLSAEQGTSIHCAASCLTTWPPLLVTSSTTSIAIAAGVKGTIGFVTRGSMKQVTFNSFPVYTYSGDTAPSQACGQGIAADGGTWTLASAAATSAGSTPVATGSGGCGYPGYIRSPR